MDRPEVAELNLRESAAQFDRPPLTPRDGRESLAPGNSPIYAGFSVPNPSGPPAIEGNDAPIDRTSPFKARS